jgi:hypothetical protein
MPRFVTAFRLPRKEDLTFQAAHLQDRPEVRRQREGLAGGREL